MARVVNPGGGSGRGGRGGPSPTPCVNPEGEGTCEEVARARKGAGRGRGEDGAGPNAETLRPRARPKAAAPAPAEPGSGAWREAERKKPAIGFAFTSNWSWRNKKPHPSLGRGVRGHSGTRTPARGLGSTPSLYFAAGLRSPRFRASFPRPRPPRVSILQAVSPCYHPLFPAAPRPSRPLSSTLTWKLCSGVADGALSRHVVKEVAQRRPRARRAAAPLLRCRGREGSGGQPARCSSARNGAGPEAQPAPESPHPLQWLCGALWWHCAAADCWAGHRTRGGDKRSRRNGRRAGSVATARGC